MKLFKPLKIIVNKFVIIISIFLLLISSFFNFEIAQNTTKLPISLQLTILFKAFEYDRNLKTRCTDSVNLALLYNGKDKASTEIKSEIVTVLSEKLKSFNIQDLPILNYPIQFTTVDQLKSEINSKKLNFIYLCPNLTKDIPEIVKFAENNKIPTITGIEEYVKKGVAIGVVAKENKSKIIINLPASKKQGINLDASLFKLAEIIN